MDFDGRKLRSFRKAKALRQDELAKKVECSRATISAAEQNNRTPQKKLIKKLADVLKVPVSDFYTIPTAGYVSEIDRNTYERFSDMEHKAIEAIIMFSPQRRRMIIQYLSQLQADTDETEPAMTQEHSETHEEKLQKIKNIVNSQKVQTKILSEDDSKIMAELRQALGPEPSEKRKRATS